MSDARFPSISRAQWEAKAKRDLRGRPLASLTRETADGIAVAPLYMAEDLGPGARANMDSAPGQFPGVRGRTLEGAGTGSGEGWLSVQTYEHADATAANAAALTDLALGAHGFRFVLDRELQSGREPASSPDGLVFDPGTEMETLLAGIDPRRTPVFFEAGLVSPEVADALEQWLDDHEDDAGEDDGDGEGQPGTGIDVTQGRPPAQGGVVYDPMSTLLATGSLERGFEPALGELVDRVLGTSVGLVGVSTAPYHDAGASPATELALALSTCAELLRRAEGLGLDPVDLTPQLLWTLPVGGRPFEAIAKLRAARAVWARFAAACGLAPEHRQIWIHVQPSRRTWTRVGPWLNLLRGTLASFAGAVGGADSVATGPFDGLCGPEGDAVAGFGRGSELGRRLALDTQVVLREESQLAQVIDPAGGSWFVESLTESLARAAWAQFQTLEGEGGLAAGLCAGSIQTHIEGQAEALRTQASTRARPVTGVSTFAVLDERGTPEQSPNVAPGDGPDLHIATPSLEPAEIRPLTPLRLAAGFEDLRSRSEEWARVHGARPTLASIEIGRLVHCQARADFAANLFRAGGLELLHIELDTGGPSSAVGEIEATGAKVAVICGRDEDYAGLELGSGPPGLGNLVSGLRAAGIQVWIAGRPGQGWGLDPDHPPGFVFLGCDALETLNAALGCALGAEA